MSLDPQLQKLYYRLLMSSYQQIDALLYEKIRAGQVPDKQFPLVDLQKLKSIYPDEPFNVEIIRVLKRILDYVLYEEGDVDRDHRKRFWLSRLQFLGAGVFGAVLKSGLKQINDFFAIKYNRIQGDIDRLQHEFIIGTALNKFRAQIPNVVYVYDLFTCSPVRSFLETPETFCLGDGPAINYLVTENVPNSVTLKKYLANYLSTDVAPIISIFRQIWEAMKVLKEIEFTHNDLHGENAIVQAEPKSENRYLVYGDLAVRSYGSIVRFIDLGMASAKIDGLRSAAVISGSVANVIYSGLYFPMYDVYRLIYYLGGVVEENKNISGSMGPIFRDIITSFYTPQEITTKKIQKTEYVLDPEERFIKISIDDFIKLFDQIVKNRLPNLPQLVKPTTEVDDIEHYDCGGFICETLETDKASDYVTLEASGGKTDKYDPKEFLNYAAEFKRGYDEALSTANSIKSVDPTKIQNPQQLIGFFTEFTKLFKTLFELWILIDEVRYRVTKFKNSYTGPAIKKDSPDSLLIKMITSYHQLVAEINPLLDRTLAYRLSKTPKPLSPEILDKVYGADFETILRLIRSV